MKPRLSPIVSLLLHVGVVFALLHLSAVEQNDRNRKAPPVKLVSTELHWHLPEKTKSGGGGPDEQAARKGLLPQVAREQYVPPTTKPPDTMPLLPVAPTILGEQETAPVPPEFLGVPGGLPGPRSDGPGGPGGIGAGKRGGGVGDESGKGTRGKGFVGGFEAPVLLYKVEPEFTESARKASLQGVVVLVADIDEEGRAVNIRVQQPLGLGLDEKAIEAVKKWRFHPGRRDGKPVRMPALIEVNFHLL